MSDDRPVEINESRDLAGSRIGIVHYGEKIPLDDGYVPGRMGKLAEWLTAGGSDVTRFLPTYSHLGRLQRPISLSGARTVEGQVHLVPSRAYSTSVSLERFRHLLDFSNGMRSAIMEHDRFDILIVGYPPPSIVWNVRRASEGRVPILVDIRDLWPDALVQTSHPLGMGAARGFGRVLAGELMLADGVVALSEIMISRAPSRRRIGPITHCINDTMANTPTTTGSDDPLQVVFVGSFGQGVDFESLLDGWALFHQQREPGGEPPVLNICGSGDREAEVRRMANGVPSVNLVGWISMTEVSEWLARSDVGVAPTRSGFGTTMNNKTLEYFAAGLYVVNTLEPEVASGPEAQGMAVRVEPTAQGWASGFLTAEQDLREIRNRRAERRSIAKAFYGRERIEDQWLTTIAQLL